MVAQPPTPAAMTDVTQILSQIEQGDLSAAEQLLPLVYQPPRASALPQIQVSRHALAPCG
jgi:hypothetical protein